MTAASPDLDPGLLQFGALLEAEYGPPLADWRDRPDWTDRESLQISRAIGLLLKEPIADIAPRPPDEIAASDTGARRRWSLDDSKIADAAWEGSWQWRLLADIDNAAKSAGGGMMTPSDPRLYLLSVRYERDVFALLAGHFLEFLCGRPGLAQAAEAGAIIEKLRHVPGLAAASPGFLAGAAFLIARMGAKTFCAWCEERSTAKDDDML